MSDRIYSINTDGSFTSLDYADYDSEALLQRLLAEYPDLLAGDQMSASSPRRWLLVSREHGVPGEAGGTDRWSVDHLFLDQDAVPTLVEVKRSSDTRIRREVVGQMLDYAANAVTYWSVETLRAKLALEAERRGHTSSDLVATLLDQEPDEDQIEGFWTQVATNLQAGRVRMVFVADVIPAELRRVVEFLNVQMRPAEVLAVEIRQYLGGGIRTLVPRVIGRTAVADGRK